MYNKKKLKKILFEVHYNNNSIYLMNSNTNLLKMFPQNKYVLGFLALIFVYCLHTYFAVFEFIFSLFEFVFSLSEFAFALLEFACSLPGLFLIAVAFLYWKFKLSVKTKTS